MAACLIRVRALDIDVRLGFLEGSKLRTPVPLPNERLRKRYGCWYAFQHGHLSAGFDLLANAKQASAGQASKRKKYCHNGAWPSPSSRRASRGGRAGQRGPPRPSWPPSWFPRSRQFAGEKLQGQGIRAFLRQQWTRLPLQTAPSTVQTRQRLRPHSPRQRSSEPLGLARPRPPRGGIWAKSDRGHLASATP
jgi:hypothetical protein